MVKGYLLVTISIVIAILASSSCAHGSADEVGWMAKRSSSSCQGPMGECLGGDDDEEFGMDSEVNRRILATSQYISYGALQKNTVPCSRRGASYYNCKPGASANPYTRSCTAITRCRS